MAEKTIELRAVKGVRNDISPESFDKTDLAVGNNIDLDERGKMFRRMGTSRIAAGAMHSLKSFDSMSLVVNNGALNSVSASGVLAPLAGGIVGRLAYSEIINEVYWSDTVNSGIVGQGVNRNWGVVPPVLPAVAVQSGDLRAGTYLYTATYARSNGIESGAPTCGSITVPASSGLSFAVAASPDKTVASIRLYISSVNGELPYLAAEVANTTTTISVAGLNEQTLPVRTLDLGPPPPGQLLGYYNGRAYVGNGRFLWYSLPHEYELFDWTSGFLAFPANLKTFAPVSTGIYLGTETETMYLDGADPSEFVRKQVAPYGTVLGTETYVRNDLLLDGKQEGMSPVWMSKTGLCLGLDGGILQNLTSDRYVLPAPLTEGASLFKIRSGTPQLVTSIYA